MDYLEVVDDSGASQRFELTRPRMIIGREPSCDICLPHPSVSRRHAQLQVTDQGRWLLQDLSSLNHIFVEDKPVQQLVLEPNKPFHITQFTLMLAKETQALATEAPEPLPEASSLPDPTWLERVQTYQRQLFRGEEPHDVLDRLAREFQRCVQPKLLAIGIASEAEYTWAVVQGDDPEMSREEDLDEAAARISDDVASSVQIWAAGRRAAADANVASDDWEAGGPLALLIPMKGRDTIVGHVYVQGLRLTGDSQVKTVPKPIVQYLSVLAALAGMMWDNLRLGALRKEQLALERELGQARQIQIDLFPATFQIDSRLEIFGVNLPSTHVSGDYYDVIRTGPDSVAFVIADAMGHGMPAALMMAAVRAALRMGLTLGLPWPATFRGLDDVVAQARGEIFVTGLVGHIDLVKQELQLLCAGHPLPSILVDGIQAQIPAACWTRPWGLEMPTKWEMGQIPLKGKQWSILCYTDGISDARAIAQRSYGAKRVAAFHAQRPQLSAEDLCQGLLSEVAVQPGRRSLEDDQTVLVLRSV